MYRIVAAVRMASGEAAAIAASQKILVPLLELGMRHITDVLSPDCSWVLGVPDLKLRFGSRRVKTKHIHALHRLAYMLHESVPGKICTNKAMLTREAVEATQARRVAAEHVPGLRAAPSGELPAELKNVIAPAKAARPQNTIPAVMEAWKVATNPTGR
jgi:hypothetical protein